MELYPPRAEERAMSGQIKWFQAAEIIGVSCDCRVRSPSITTRTERSSTTGCNMNGRFSGH